MNRPNRPELLDVQHSKSNLSTARSRSRSGSIENPISSQSISANPLVNASPAPAYIAPSAATRLVTSDHEEFFNTLREDGVVGAAIMTMHVSPGSLLLVNQFLDFLLYSFLSNAKSTSLSALRPAIAEVLRIRLAREAVAGADQELKSYLGGGDEDIEGFDDTLIETNGEGWNLDNIWRKCRVQCMVYSSLGDLEEDDEAFYSENGLEGAVGPEQYQKQSDNPSIVSPAVAIWLTSILEFIGEQTLLVAGHATIARYSAQRIAAANSGASYEAEGTFPEKPTVEELDTEKVALNPSLGRMWRQWRKKVRGSNTRGSFSVPATRDGVLQRLERQASFNKRGPASDDGRTASQVSMTPSEEAESLANKERGQEQSHLQPDSSRASLPETVLTPIVETATPGIHDGYKKGDLRDDEDNTGSLASKRPQSLIILPWTHLPPFIKSTAVKRPASLPDLKRGDFADPNTEGEDAGENFFTPIEERYEYIYVPLPEPAPNEEEELADAIVVRDEYQDPIKTTELSSDVEEEAVSPIQITDGVVLSAPQPGSAGSDKRGFRKVTVIPEARNKTAEVLRKESAEVKPSPVQQRQVQEDYDPYASKPSFPQTRAEPRLEPPTRPRVDTRTAARTETSTDFDSPILRHGRSEPGTPSHVKHSSSSSTGQFLSDRKIGQLQVVHNSASPSSDRSNMRVWTPPATPDKSRRSSSFSKSQRPIHTSGSTSSQASILKTFIPWNDGGKHTRVHESDGESRSSYHSERLANMDDKERSFEELISSGGTIHCTITPDPLRNMEKVHQSPRTATADLANFIRNAGPDGRPSTSKSVTGIPRVQAVHRTTPAGVRDVQLNDTASLSEFLRKTGPAPGSPGYSKLQRMGTQEPTTPTLAAPTGFRNDGSMNSPTIAGLPSVIRQVRSDSPIAQRSRNRLMAREASGNAGSDTTSALADFFRNTNPPTNGDIPIHRISRSVAPFRTTMDSAQFGPGSDDIIEEIEPDTSTKTQSISSSVPHEAASFTSSTALLRSNSRRVADYGSSSAKYQPVQPAAPEVKRKQVRNKDPYALIDGLDDDDDDSDIDGLSLMLPKKRQEESLVDFLKNTPPPPQNDPLPLLDTSNAKTIQKKSSSVSLMSRFGRSTRKNSIASNADKMPPPSPISTSAKYVPLKVPNNASDVSLARRSSGSDSYSRPSYTQARADFDNQFNVGTTLVSARNPPRPQVQARGARLARNDTDSLADFLKRTGPPPEPVVHRKEEQRSLLSKMSFSKNKKVGVA